jgi:hypothetical protein
MADGRAEQRAADKTLLPVQLLTAVSQLLNGAPVAGTPPQ